jgi:hypothetical protein
MFGTVQEPAGADPVAPQPAKPVSALGQQAQAFFAGRGGKVASTTTPRPTRPGAPTRQRPAATRVVTATPPASLFTPVGANAAAARTAEMEAEADIIDDTFDDAFDSDAPGC